MNEGMKTIRVLSLGAGVQSTTIALKIATGELPPIDAAVFADTQEEPAAVYTHLAWLMARTEHHFPTLIRTIGKLGENLMKQDSARGEHFVSIPAFTKALDDKEGGIIRRQCTRDYKLDVIERTIRREILGLKPRQWIPKDIRIVQLLGLSADEPRRVLRARASMAGTRFEPEFPLYDQFWTRANCITYLAKIVPHEVPRSACVFCPYHDNAEWRRLKTSDPKGWKRAIEVDEALRKPGNIMTHNMDQLVFLHRSCVPLSEADISGPDAAPQQYGLSFERECTGMCGV